MCYNLVSPGSLTSDDIFKATVKCSWIIKLECSLPSLPFSFPSHHSAKKVLSRQHPRYPRREALNPILLSHEQLKGRILASVVKGPLACGRGDDCEHVVAMVVWMTPQLERLPDVTILIAMCFEPCNRIFKGIQEKQKGK